MEWLNQDIPAALQWLGLLATVGGAGMALWAALSAMGAKRQAKAAVQAATRLGWVVQVGDLVTDLQELQPMLARKDFESIAAKCTYLRGRVVRFKTEAYNLLGEKEAADIDIVRDQLEIIAAAATQSKGLDKNRISKIQVACGNANEALNKVFAIHHLEARGE